jgi:ABC-2 type transport system permease protein
MSRTSPVLLVARREFVERLRDRTFQVSTAVTLVILLGVIIIPHLLSGGGTSYTLGVVGDRARSVAAAVSAAGSATDITIKTKAFPDQAAAETAVRKKDVTAALTDRAVIVREDLPGGLAPLLQPAAQRVAALDRLREQGIDPARVAAALASPPLPVRALQPRSASADANKTLAFFGIIVLYGQLATYGFWVASGVVEEKASRIIEVLLAAIRPRQLLTGKLLGIGLLGLGVLVLQAVVALPVAVAIGAFDLPTGWVGTLSQVLLWFLLGYAFYATIFAGAAATVSRQEELQNAITPLTLLIFVSLILGFGAANNPGSTLATVASYVPPLSVLVMPSRWAAGEVGVGQLALSVGLMLVAVLAIAALAVRLYEGAVLRVGAKVRLRDAWRSTARR